MSGYVDLNPEVAIARVARAVTGDEGNLAQVLERVPAATYVTDRRGTVVRFNDACIALAGRQPRANRDRWCVTWKLYTEQGVFLPHHRCPMAVAIRGKRKLRGIRAIAERPDGTRIRFTPFPTPLLGNDGELLGAVNLLVDLADPRYLAFLRSQAERCRRLAVEIDGRSPATLLLMADEYERQARALPRPN